MPSDDSNLQVTSVEEWGQTPAEKGIRLELPSGKVVRAVRGFNILGMLQTGKIPNPLRKIVAQMIQSEGDPTQIPMSEMSEDALIQMADLMDQVVCETVVEPPFDRPAPRGEVVNEVGVQVNPNETEEEHQERLRNWRPKEGHVSVFLMDVNDKLFLFAFAQGQAVDLKPFREQQGQHVEPVADGEGVPRPSKRTGGTTAKKSGGKKKAAAKRKS